MSFTPFSLAFSLHRLFFELHGSASCFLVKLLFGKHLLRAGQVPGSVAGMQRQVEGIRCG